MPRKSVLGTACTVIAAALALVTLAVGRTHEPAIPAATPPAQSSPAVAQEPAVVPLVDVFAMAYRGAVPAARAVAWAAKVTYLMGSEFVRTLTNAQASAGDLWVGCPRGAVKYAARRCLLIPQRILNGFVWEGAELIAEQAEPKVVGCDLVRRPHGTVGLTAVSVRPDLRHRDCFSDFAITLYLNAHNQVEAVNFVLSSP